VKELWILRHGKASSGSPDGEDHSRPLTGRGRRQSDSVATFVTEQLAAGLKGPDLVISSTATRALKTAEPVHGILPAGVPLDVERDLYGADPDDVIDRLRLLPDDVSVVMIVGHNPTFEDLSVLLLDSDDAKGRAALKDGLPTGTLVRLSLDIDTWSALVPGSGHLEEFFVPSR
jgi:phosphohistidine phosphatase